MALVALLVSAWELSFSRFQKGNKSSKKASYKWSVKLCHYIASLTKALFVKQTGI